MRPARLTLCESLVVALVGVFRHVWARCDRRGNTRGYRPDERAIDQDVQAAGAECAAAKALGRYWPMTFDRSDTTAGDIAGGDGYPVIQVRHTRHLDGGLRHHDEDDDAHAFLLVTGAVPNFQLRGWLWGRDARGRRERRDKSHGWPRPGWCVPQEQLESLDDFPSHRPSRFAEMLAPHRSGGAR